MMKYRTVVFFTLVAVMILSACSPTENVEAASEDPVVEDVEEVVEEEPVVPDPEPEVEKEVEEEPAPEAEKDAIKEPEVEEEIVEKEAEKEPECEPSYPDLCLPVPRDVPPSMTPVTCETLEESGFTVLSPDPYALDANGDGLGCVEGEKVPATRQGCDPWPREVALVLRRLPLPNDICLQIRNDLSGPTLGWYDPERKVAVVKNSNDKDELLGRIIHEVCHGNQHKAVLDNGSSGLTAEKYFATQQGREFLEANDAAHGPELGFVRDIEGSNAPCIQWYVEALGIDPGGILPPWSDEIHTWAKKWFPLWPED